ncbi:DUF6932 family protein [Sphingomonas sp. HT-1]|uniref:DUF6932 family protein n=1 Tax=unclassified Sphingomonas TaxID=196159 RepID=UPI00037D506E|nr:MULTISPECIES: hypothetical protein [unclassified Sphingomonas]KTF69092.1 hypothetical protein ATB93_10535 [Sphingomonas sp. WG]
MTDSITAMRATSRRQDTSGPAMLLDPIDAPLVTRSSPHLMRLDAFKARFCAAPKRQQLWTSMISELHFMRSQGVPPMCLLIGGSFVGDGESPNDLDALVVYRLAPDARPDAIDVLLRRRREGLDLRFVAGDAGPVPLIKMSCFFHTLYQSRDRGGDQASYLIVLQD